MGVRQKRLRRGLPAVSLVGGVMEVALIVRDRDAFPFALEETGLADDAFRAVDDRGFLAPELEFRCNGRIVHHLRELVTRFHLEDIDRTNIPTVGAAGALPELYVDLYHSWSLRVLAEQHTPACLFGLCPTAEATRDIGPFRNPPRPYFPSSGVGPCDGL